MAMDSVTVVVAAAVVMMVVEQLRPGMRQPTVPGWIARLCLLNAVQVGVVYLGAATWDQMLPQFQLVDASALGPIGGAAVGYLVITFVFYWWHRARHEIPWLWRLHQLHHSPARIEVLTSFYKHPLEIAINGVLMSTLLFVVIGLSPATAAIVTAVTGIAELVYHWNIATPHWLGYWFQRPESHRRHHERNFHRCNYSDLPVWDLLFGTFDNPREAPVDCGFPLHQERQLARLLTGRAPR